MDKAAFFILNVFINSLLAFFTVVLLIEGIIFLFRIRQGRVAATLRMLPILKLPFDLYLYDFSKWAYLQGINPLQCEEGTRTLSLMLSWSDSVTRPVTSGIEFFLPGNLTFTLADVVGHLSGSQLTLSFAVFFLLLTSFFFVRRLVLYYRSYSALKMLTKNHEPLPFKIINPVLKSYKLKIATSSQLQGAPFVAGSIVYIPRHLTEKLSQEEYEAVLAHELEHIRHKDSLVRLLLDFIETIFWWIPTKWLHRRIEEGQEVACDSKCKKYGMDQLDLASAICKSARSPTPPSIFAHYLTKNAVHKRLDLLLQPGPVRFARTRFALSLLGFGFAFLMVFLGKFWTF